jgi:hypothetical protein
MRKVIRINPKTHLVCIPEEMVEDGMVGDVDSYPNAVTLTLVTPGASLEDVEASLKRTLEDIQHRIKFGERERPEPAKRAWTKHVPAVPAQPKPGGLSVFDELRKKIGR